MSTDPQPDGRDEDGDDLLCRLDELVDAMLARLRDLEVSDSGRAFDLAERLQQRLQDAGALVIERRDDLVVAIWRADRLSLAQLARRIGRSKARADQITRAVLARRGEQPPSEP